MRCSRHLEPQSFLEKFWVWVSIRVMQKRHCCEGWNTARGGVTGAVSAQASRKRLSWENPGRVWGATTSFDLAQKSTLYPKDFYSRNLQSENTKAGGQARRQEGERKLVQR